jgi:1-acyl-sn-glycerol-3-phosphate acyltransferase
MQNIVIDKPYVFVPPYRGRWWCRFLQKFVPGRLRRNHGIASVECHGLDKLKASIAAGHGVLIAPNHCRPADPETIQEMLHQAGLVAFFMASWHLFMQSRLQTFILRRVGGFSIYREGMDRTALNTAIDILATAERPLVIFPEGVVTRTNDRLYPLLEGMSFIARSAARKRAGATPPGQVVVHPVATRYRYQGDVRATIEPVLADIEHRLAWRPQKYLGLQERIARVGQALLTLKEIECLGQAQSGTIAERLQRLIDAVLGPLEKEWLRGERAGHVVERVKRLRAAVVPDMARGELTEEELQRRWRQLADMYLAEQLACYPPNYLAGAPTPERLLETVERYEEDLTDTARPHYPLVASITVGEAIPVSAGRERGGEDPLLTELERQLKQMLGLSA